MQKSYGVVWREGDRPVAAGKLELQPRALRLEGRDGRRELPYEDVADVHIGRAAADRIDGRASVVVQPVRGPALTISAVAQANLIGEIAERIAELQLGVRRGRRLVVIVPLKAGRREDVRALLDAGPPFDPNALGNLDRHQVFLTAEEAVFVFESELGAEAFETLLDQPELWQAAADWRDYLAGPLGSPRTSIPGPATRATVT